jgi:hypothetical protein
LCRGGFGVNQRGGVDCSGAIQGVKGLIAQGKKLWMFLKTGLACGIEVRKHETTSFATRQSSETKIDIARRRGHEEQIKGNVVTPPPCGSKGKCCNTAVFVKMTESVVTPPSSSDAQEIQRQHVHRNFNCNASVCGRCKETGFPFCT